MNSARSQRIWLVSLALMLLVLVPTAWAEPFPISLTVEPDILGDSWELVEEDLGIFSQWCVYPIGSHTVTVRLSDGTNNIFRVSANPECTFLVPTVDVTLEFIPVNGAQGTLVQLDYGVVRIVGDKIVDLAAPSVGVDPEKYRYTLGTKFYDLRKYFKEIPLPPAIYWLLDS